MTYENITMDKMFDDIINDDEAKKLNDENIIDYLYSSFELILCNEFVIRDLMVAYKKIVDARKKTNSEILLHDAEEMLERISKTNIKLNRELVTYVYFGLYKINILRGDDIKANNYLNILFNINPNKTRHYLSKCTYENYYKPKINEMNKNQFFYVPDISHKKDFKLLPFEQCQEYINKLEICRDVFEESIDTLCCTIARSGL